MRRVKRTAQLGSTHSHRPLDTTVVDCPEAEALVAMATGELSPERREEIATHASSCAECRAALDALLGSQAADPMASTLASPGEDRLRPRQQLSEGDHVDRYVIETV